MQEEKEQISSAGEPNPSPNEKAKGFSARIKAFARETVLCTLQALILTLIIINFVGRVSIVQGSSMSPTLFTDNRVLVNLMAYHFGAPKRGEIVIFQCPVNPGRDYIKRVIGLPGEVIQVKDGVVLINGNSLDEPYLEGIDLLDNVDPTVIPKGKVYVMGDNRQNSEDSRFFGSLDEKLIKGKAQLIFWPPKSFHVLK